MSALLVSVQSVAEAQAALRGGADLIDIKDPSRGSLGRADDATLLAIVDVVSPRHPISAALGELTNLQPLPPTEFLRRANFVKVGLAKSLGTNWRDAIRHLQATVTAFAPHCRLSVAAYADSSRASSPSLDDVLAFAMDCHLSTLLIDTWLKDGSTLLDWFPLSRLADICHRCHDTGIEIALAGSLDQSMICRLQNLQPNWFAVRGAACRLGNRVDAICEQRVRTLAALVHAAPFNSRSGNAANDSSPVHGACPGAAGV